MNMMINTKRIIEYFIQAFPAINQDEQLLSLTLYRQLASGKPVKVEDLHSTGNLSRSMIDIKLHNWPGVFFDDEDNVVGFWGLALHEMPHQLKFNDHTVYAWCAWDTLFIPELIGRTARIISHCPVTDRRIELTVSPSHVETVDNKPVFLSFVTPDANLFNDDLTFRFCHYVYFFDSKSVANHWIAEHPNTFLLSLDDAFVLAKRVNAARYHLTLH